MVSDLKEEPRMKKWTLTKLEAVGGKGGHLFDSGCNPSGVKKVRIEYGKFDWNGNKYLCLVKRVFLDFTDGNAVSYIGCGVCTTGKVTSTFELCPNDEISKVVVWSDDKYVTAIQFYTMAGIVSPMYGIPKDKNSKDKNSVETTFEGGPGSRLVGIHGRFAGVIDKLGFTFAVASDVPCEIGNTVLTGDTSDHDSVTMVSMGAQEG
ncbi:expressed unknown protein [Seminavis robusta]|uniref:Jacalin-type lectin domain-containing protein n=1 Tax=Seminavis robusta TaxID=568900 RepID=A0A9N8EDP5_9STRA|nr:expressed unknown protein [Seminavis robusta]|eukprot:Sro1025_g232770.1 n/a (206) ;mRNA; f:16928-17545